MSELTLKQQYQDAPKSVKVGRILMIVGCVLFFIMAVGNVFLFVFGLTNPDTRAIMTSDLGTAMQFFSEPALSVFLILCGIGGLCFVFDRGGRFRSFATLGAVILLVVIVIDTVLCIRTLVRDLAGINVNSEGQPVSPGAAWLQFFLNILDIQLSGGIYFIGWMKCKDFVGD